MIRARIINRWRKWFPHSDARAVLESDLNRRLRVRRAERRPGNKFRGRVML